MTNGLGGARGPGAGERLMEEYVSIAASSLAINSRDVGR